MKFLTRKGFLIEEQGMSYLADPRGANPGFHGEAISLCLAFPARRPTHPALQRFTLTRPIPRPARLGWARLLKRVFDIDIEQCPQCGGTLTILAAIEDPSVIAKILTHLGLPARAPTDGSRPGQPAGTSVRFRLPKKGV